MTATKDMTLHVDDGGDGIDQPAHPLRPAGSVVALAETDIARVREGEIWFAEGRRAVAGGASDAYISTGTADATRRVTLRCAAMPYDPRQLRAAPAADVVAGAARAVLDRYFDALTAGDLGAAAACFARDCLYSHPPYRAGQARHTFLGRDGLLAGWRAHRGAIDGRPEILVCAQEGALAFAEGVAGGGTFLSSVLLDRDGLIRRYVALFRRPQVPVVSH